MKCRCPCPWRRVRLWAMECNRYQKPAPSKPANGRPPGGANPGKKQNQFLEDDVLEWYDPIVRARQQKKRKDGPPAPCRWGATYLACLQWHLCVLLSVVEYCLHFSYGSRLGRSIENCPMTNKSPTGECIRLRWRE